MIERMAAEGCSKSSMARAIGLSRSTVYALLGAASRSSLGAASGYRFSKVNRRVQFRQFLHFGLFMDIPSLCQIDIMSDSA